MFLTSVPATVGCRVACAPRARNRRRPRVEGSKVVPWPTRRGRNMHRHISRRLHPLHVSQNARRPQGRVAAERRRATSKTTKAAAGGEFRKNNTALGSDGQGPKGFSFGFLDLFDFLIFLLTWREHAWVSWSVRRGRARSCEYVWIAQSHSGRSSSLDARGPGPDLTWQRTLAVVVCVALEGVFKGRK